MLSGARNHRHSILSQKLYDRMKSLFPDQKSHLIAASVLLSNTYSSVGDEQRAQEVRISRLNQFGKKIKAGLSWTEVNGELVVSVQATSTCSRFISSFFASLLKMKRNSELMIDHILDLMKSMLNLIDCLLNSKSMDMSSTRAGSLVHSAMVKVSNQCCVDTVRSWPSHSISSNSQVHLSSK
jgi:hypothetical protein